MTLAAAGVALGIVLSLLAARWLRALVFGVSPHDPATLGAAAVGLVVVAFFSCALPAMSATKIDPAITLKGE